MEMGRRGFLGGLIAFAVAPGMPRFVGRLEVAPLDPRIFASTVKLSLASNALLSDSDFWGEVEKREVASIRGIARHIDRLYTS